MSRITMCIEEEFEGKVIGSFDLTEYADRVYNQALEDFANEIRPIISEYQQAIKKNHRAFIDVECIKQRLVR